MDFSILDAGIVQLIIGGVLLYVALGVLKGIAKTAFWIVVVLAAASLIWGSTDLISTIYNYVISLTESASGLL